jgi:serine/threonine protein kinase
MRKTPDVDELNAQLPAYEFSELLGRGGAGWVFRALQRSLHRPVAIKILHGAASGISDAAQRFAREAQILARLKHPRIVTVHDYGALPESQYLVMEYVPGPTLRDVLRSTSLTDKAVHIGDQICEAVEYAHSMGVLHRDLKPENVLFDSIDRLDTLKVADFGISRLIGDTEPGFHQTQTGFVVGTPFYAAPEQMAGDQPIDARADIYSIGVMLYEMLTDQLPRGRFPAPSRLKKVPTGIDAVVLRCLESDPAKRYPDVASLRQGLREVLTGTTQRRRLIAFSAVAAAIAALGVWAASAYFGGRPTDTAQPNPGKQESKQSGADSKTTNLTPAPTQQPSESAAPNSAPNVPADQRNQPTTAPTTPSDSPPIPAPTTSRLMRDDENFDISDVTVYGFVPSMLEFRIDGRLAYDGFKLQEGASLVWVIQTGDVDRVAIPFELPAGTREFTIAQSRMLGFRSQWPIEVYIAERVLKPTTSIRRLSNAVRINSSDMKRGPAPPATPKDGRVVIPPPSDQIK